MTNYPNNLDNIITLPTVDGSTQQDIAINAIRDAVIAIEQELGITPSGVYSDFRNRVDILESRFQIANTTNQIEAPLYLINTLDPATVSLTTGLGAPTSNENNGSLYLRADGYANSDFYLRRNNAWVPLVTTQNTVAYNIPIVYPSASASTEIQALLNDNTVDDIMLAPGNYYLDTPLTFPVLRKKRLFCPDIATFIPLFTGSGATNRENAVIIISGTVTADVNTTLAVDGYANRTVITTAASIPTAQAGKWLRIKGVNPQLDFLGDSSENTVSEIIDIVDGHTTGTTVNLQRPLSIHHDSTHTVQSINPCIDVELEGILIDATGNNSIAVGVLVKDSMRVSLKRVQGKNLSFSVISYYGSKLMFSENITNRGSCNSTLYRETSHHGLFVNTIRTNEGNRTHALGWPQHELTTRAHCVGILDDGGFISHSVGGIRMWGGISNHANNFVFYDLDITEAAQRDPEGDITFGETTFGIVFDGGPGSVGSFDRSAEFGFGNSISNIRATNIKARNRYGVAGGIQPAFYIHDTWNFNMVNVGVENIGLDPTSASGVPCSGIVCSDCSGNIVGVTLRGIDLGIMTKNVRDNLNIDNVIMISYAGKNLDTVGGPAFVFAHNGGKFCSPRFGRVRIQDFGDPNSLVGPIEWAPEFASGPDRDLHFDELSIESLTYCDVRPARCPAFSYGPVPPNGGPYPGQIGTINSSASHPPEVSVATGPSTKNVVFATIPQNGWALIAYGNADIYAPSNSKIGDMLVAGTDGFPVLSTDNPPPACYWIITGQYINSYGKAFATPKHSSLQSPQDISLISGDGYNVFLKNNTNNVISAGLSANIATIKGYGSSGMQLGPNQKTTTGTGTDLIIHGQAVQAGQEGTSANGNINMLLGRVIGTGSQRAAQINIKDHLGTALEGYIYGVDGPGGGSYGFRMQGATAGTDGRGRGIVIGLNSPTALEFVGADSDFSMDSIGSRLRYYSITRLNVDIPDTTITAMGAGTHTLQWYGAAGQHKINKFWNTVTTTTATTTTILTSPAFSNDTSVTLIVTLKGTNTTASEIVSYSRSAAFRTNGGTTTQVGSAFDLGTFEDAGLSGCDISISTSTNTILIRAVSVATNLRWECYAELIYGGIYS